MFICLNAPVIIHKVLQKYYNIETELLLAHILKKPKEFLFMEPNFKLSSYQVRKLSSLIQRRQKGEPVAYILGYKDFCGLRFKVNRNVLIPRPETEGLVERIAGLSFPFLREGVRLRRTEGLEHYRQTSTTSPSFGGVSSLKRRRELRILDLGTGSGCIIISLAKKLQNLKSDTNVAVFKFYGSDVSKKVLQVAKQNARHHQTKVKFIKSALLQNIKEDFDIIIANLPYGWREWKNNTSAETVGLKFEPKEALFTKEHGLYHIRRLLEQIAKRKRKPKLVFLEFDPRQKHSLFKLIKKYLPSSRVEFHRDLNNLWRFAEVQS